MSNLPNLNSFRKDSTEKSFYSIVEFSEITNLAKNTLRSLEKEFGLEVFRDAKGNRVYKGSDIERFLYAFNLRGNEHNSNSNSNSNLNAKSHNTSSNQSLNEEFSLLLSSKPLQQISEITEQREFKTPKFLKLLKTLSNPLKNLNLASLLSFPIIVSTFLSVFAFSSLNDFLDAPRNLELFPSNTKSQNTASVLQSTSDIYEYRFDVNIPAYFNSTVNISADLTTQGNITSTGNAIFNTASFQNIEVGEVTITPTGISAPNIVNSLNLEDGEDNLVLDNDDPNNPVLSLNTNLNLSELTVDTLNSSTLNGITEIDAESAQTIQQAINFSTDAITLNGLSSDNFLRSNTSTTYSGGVFGLSSGASFEALSGSSLTIKQGSLFEVSSGATFKFSNVPANSYLKVDSSGNLSYFNINAGNNITITTSPNSVVITGVDPSILDSLAVGTLFFGPSHEEQYRLLPSLSELNKLYTLAGSILSSSNITSFYPNLDTDATNDLIISTLASSNVYSINTWYGFQDFTRISAFNTEIEQNGSIKFTSGAVPTSYSGRLYYSSNRMFFEELPIAMYYDSTYDHLGKLAQFETDASGRLLLRGTSELSIDLFESGAPNQILGAVPLGGGGTSTEYVSIGGDLSMSISGTLASYTLNTVNTNPGTFGGEYYIPIVTVDGKGRVTAVTTTPNANVFPNYITNISFSTPSPAHRTFILERAGFSDAYATFSLAPVDITTALNYTPLNKAGDTMSGSLLVQGNITSTQTISSSSLISSFGSITNLSSSTLTLTNPLSVIYGGTGKTETPANGQLLIGDSGGYTLSTLTGGTNVSINSSAGYISISSIDTYITGLSFSDSAPNRKLLTITRNNLTPLSNVFSLSASDITTALNYTPLNKSGDTMSGSLLVQSSINATQNITSNTTISAPTLIQNGNGVCDLSGNCLAATQAIVGAGSAGYIPRFLGTYSIADSTLFQDSYSNISIGGTNPGEKLDVFGAIRLSTDMGTGPRALALYQDQGNLYWNGQAVGVIGGTGPGGIIGQVGYFPFFNTTTSLVNSDFQYISNVNERGLELITTNNIPVYLGIGRSGNETFKMGVASDNSNFFGAGETAEDVVLINQSTNASSDLVFSNIGVQSRFLFKFGPNPNPSEIISMKYSQANTNSRLGINTTDPRSELEVVGSALITDTLAVATFSNPSSTQAFTFLSGGNFNGNLSASNATLNVISGVSLTLSGNAIISGNLGLGNTNPTSRLDMTGNLNLENTSSSTTGVITKNGVSFISNFAHPTGGSATPDGFNTFIGLQSGNFTTGSTVSQTNEASRNTALGYQTLKDITTAYENTALGAFALRDLINGYQNTAIGSNALMLSTTAYQNTVLGANALSGLTTGHQNIAIGYSAGRYLSNGSTLNNHSENSIYIGLNTKSKQASSTNEIVIGNSQTGLGDNSIILGNSSNLITALTGNVGLGTTNPSEKLEVVGTIKGDSLNILGTGAINTLTLTNALSPIYGGTGITQTPASGQILIGNASGGYSLETLLEGTNVDISIASSSVTISSEDRYLTNANFTDSAPNRKVLTLTQVDKTGNTIPEISANFSLSSSDITTALNYTPVNKSGDTMSGSLLVQGNITSTQTMSSSTAIFTRTQTNTFFLKDVSQSNTLQLEANVGSTNRKLILDLNQGTLDNTTLSLKGMQSVNFQSASNDKNLTFNFISPDQNRTFDVLNQGTLPAINANILDIYNATLSASTFSSPSSNTFNFLNGTVIATTFSGSASGLTSLNAGNLTGTIPSSVLAGSSLFIGTTEIPLNRTSGAQALTGITGISSTTSLSLTAGGSNQNITLTPSGTGYTLLNGNVGLSFTLPQNLLTVGSYNSATSSNLKQGLLSVDNTLLAQLEGGAYFGRVGITENQWGITNQGVNWVKRESLGSSSWRSVAVSSDGKFQTAVVSGGNIYTSTDFGANWTARDSSRSWRGVAMSSDGKIQTAVVNSGQIYTSTNYGASWTARESSRAWYSVSMSSDGKIQTAVVNGGKIYTSTDYGVNWIERDSNRDWWAVSVSSDGKVQTAVVSAGKIYNSYDYGLTWVENTTTSNLSWFAVSVSSDGKTQTAVASDNYVYTSTDYGATWTARITDTARNWTSISMSANGKNQTAGSFSDQLYTSSDYGVTWSAQGPTAGWYFIAMSSDGRMQTAIDSSGYLYTSYADSYILAGNIGIGMTFPKNLLTIGNFDAGTYTDSSLGVSEKQGLLSIDNTLLAQLEGGAYFGRVGITENQWGNSNYGNSWTLRGTAIASTDIAMSTDGKIQTTNTGYVSYDYGATWTSKVSASGWGVAMSSDGKIQAITEGDCVPFTGCTGGLHFSNDYGNTWTTKSITSYTAGTLYGLAISSDGKRITVASNQGYLHTSSDYGNTWVSRDSNRNWNSVAMSSDGKIQVAPVYQGNIYISKDYGETWGATESVRDWWEAAISDDGRIMTVVATNSGYIYISYDYGANWNQKESTRNWLGIAMSSNGKIQTATVDNGLIYVSTDFGNTWSSKDSSRTWRRNAMSSDGKIQSAVEYNSGQVYTSYADSYMFAGNVGIGTTSPDARLHVGNADWDQIIRIDGKNPAFQFREANASNSNFVIQNVNGSLRFASANNTWSYTDLARITSTGNVGIGLTSPNARLAVNGAALIGYGENVSSSGVSNGLAVNGRVGIGTTSPLTRLHVAYSDPSTAPNTAVTGLFIQNTSTTTNAINGLSFVNAGGFNSASIYTQQANFGNAGDKLFLNTKTSTGSWNTGIVMDTLGNVGIGTTSPNQKLAVEGSIAVNPSNARFFTPSAPLHVFGNNISSLSDSTVQDILRLSQSNTASASKGSHFAIGLSFWESIGNNFPRTRVDFKTSGRSTDSESTPFTVMSLRDDGNVGVGTTNPGETLDVAGSIRSNSAIPLKFINIGSGTYQSSVIYNNSTNGFYIDVARLTEASNGTPIPFSIGPRGSLPWFRISNNGNVGIGTTNPTFKLDIQDTNTSFGVNIGSSTQTSFSNLIMTSNLGTGQIWKAGSTYGNSWGGNSALNVYNSSGPVAIFSNGSQSNVLFMNNSGNVGIGTMNPYSRLYVAGGELMVDSGVGGVTNGAEIRIATNNVQSFIGSNQYYGGSPLTIRRSRAGGSSLINFDTSTGSNAGDITFFNAISGSADSAVSFNSNMVIKTGGNVGIGTISPASKLDVRGSDYRLSNSEVVKEFTIDFPHGQANQKVDFYMTGEQSLWGTLEVTVTDAFSFENASGLVKKVYGLGILNGSNYTNESRYTEVLGATADNWALSDLSWDSTNNRYKITLVHRKSSGNSPRVVFKFIAHHSQHATNFQTLTNGPIYTNDTTVYQRPYEHFNNQLGIGTTSPSQALHVVGNARFTSVGSGAFSNNLNIMSDGTLTTSTSDERLKTNLRYLTGTLDKVLQLKPYYFNWIDDVENREDIGLVAQQVEPIFPEIVFTNQTDGFMGINYDKLGVILTVALQEQQTQISTLSQDSLTLSSVSTNLSSAMQSLVTSSSNLESVNGNLSLAMNNLISTQASFELRLSQLESVSDELSNAYSSLTLSDSSFSLSLNTLNLKQEELSTALGSLNLTTFQSMYDSLQNTLDALTMDTLNGELVISSDLLVNGDSIFNNATFTGDVSIGQMSFNTLDNSLNVLGASCVNLDNTLDDSLCTSQTLYVMKNTSGYIDFFDGQITFKPNGDLEVKKVTTEVLEITDFSAPTPTDSCTKGQIKFGEETGISYIYVCTSDNNWKRSELSSY